MSEDQYLNSDNEVVKVKDDPKKPWKELVSAAVALCAYLFGVVSGDENLLDVTTQEWLGGFVVVGAAFGFTKGVSNPKVDQR